MVNSKLESLAYRLEDLTSLRSIFCELNFDFVDEPVNEESWKDEEKEVIENARIIAKKDDYKIYYLQTNTDSLKHWKGIATKIIKENHGLCLICSHNPGGFKWIFSSLSKEFSKSFSETRHIPIDINPNSGVPTTFVDFLDKLDVADDSTTSIVTKVSGAFDSFAIQIHDELTVNVFEALKILSEGIISDKKNKLSLNYETLEEIREPIFILLYRIIFILYAEDRGIFPTENKTYHKEFSLKWIKEEWLLKEVNLEKLDEYVVEDRLKKLFRLIEVGSEELDYNKDEFFMRSYYGRIFDRKINHKLEEWKIPNKEFSKALSFITRTMDRKGNYFFLDYSALETRHLGSIYEKLLEFHLEIKDKKIKELPDPQERKDSGSFFTPKVIVDNLTKNTIEPIVDKIIEENSSKQTQIEKILSLKILDPAMGSGHFLVGVVEYLAKRICQIEFDDIPEQSYIERKRDVVRKCIYGVDINPLSVDLAKLSLWLETISSEKPLSFLSAHIKCGNTVIGTEIKEIFDKQTTLFESEKGKNTFKKNLKKFLMFEDLEDDSSSAVKMKIEEYNKMQSKGTLYYDLKFLLDCKVSDSFGIKVPNLGDYRAKIGQNSLDFYSSEIYQNVKKISEELRFFHWDLEFPEIFYDENAKSKEDPGFDIIIGNPPYVRQEQIKELKSSLEKRYEIFVSTADLYTYFYEQGLSLLCKKGMLGYISSNKFMRTVYGLSLRSFLRQNYCIKQIIDFGDKHLFDAITNTMIVVIKKQYEKNNKIIFRDNLESTEFLEIKQNELDDEGWTLENEDYLNLKKKIEKQGIVLKEWNVKINRGLLTGFNDAFLIDKEKKDYLNKQNSENNEIIKPVIRGRDIEQYYYKKPNAWIINTHNGYRMNSKIIPPINVKKDFPEIYEHLDQMDKQTRGSRRVTLRGRGDQGQDWTNLRNCAFLQDFKTDKIIWIELTNENRFAYSTKEEYLLAGAFVMTGESLKYLLAFLNSPICKFYFKTVCTTTGMGAICWKKFAMEKIPIPKIDHKEQKPFISLVDEILTITNKPNFIPDQENLILIKEIEEKINSLFYKMYEFTPEQIEIISKS